MLKLPKFITPWRATVFLAIVSTICFFKIGELIISRPTGLPNQLRAGYIFTVVAMKSTKPVELFHQCSGYVLKRIACLDGKRRTGKEVETTANRKAAEALVEKPIVWADTGRAIGNYRYYLTEADLPILNSQLDRTDGEYTQDYTVTILKDDPVKKIQTIQVVVWSGGCFTSVYNVENNSIKPPLKWNYLREQAGIAVVVLFPFVLVGAGCFWGFVIWFVKLIYNRNQYIQKNP